MAKAKFSLSIIVPVLNEQEQIVETLERLNQLRIQAQHDYPAGTELLVVDGGSSDATLQLCRGLADKVISAPRGRGAQLSAGVAVAAGETLIFVHADTRLTSDVLPALARTLSRFPERHWGRFDVEIVGRARLLPLIANMMNLRSAWTGIATGDQAMFVRRSSLDAAGGFPNQPLMEDIELSKRLLRLPGGRPLRMRQKVRTSGRRWDSRGVWRTVWLMWSLRWRYWRGTPADRLAEVYR